MSPEERIARLEEDLRTLKLDYYANNFPTSQDFTKYVRFNARVKVPSHSTLPSTCEVGELAEASGKLYVCSAANSWSVAGTQS